MPTVEVPAREDVIALSASREYSCEAFLATPQEATLVRLAFGAYGFILRSLSVERPARLTLKAFAQEISKVYDATEPHTKMVIAALMLVHSRQMAAAAKGQMLQVPLA